FHLDRSAAIVAAFPPPQAARVPSSVANIKWLATLVLPAQKEKSEVLLNTMPEGVPPAELSGVGMVTGGRKVAPVLSYIGLSPVPLSDIQIGPDGATAIPQGFTRVL